MIFLFSLINISFTFFFFIFGRFFESAFFWILSIVCIVYFSTLLSFFIEKQELDNSHDDVSVKKPSLIKKYMVFFIKKGSYYLAFLFFYISLYGIVYSVNIIYENIPFFDVFQYVTLGLSVFIAMIYSIFFRKKHETVYLLFRSNSIIFTFIYIGIIFYSLFTGFSLHILSFINIIFPLITLTAVIFFDTFIRGLYDKYIYTLLLSYSFLVILLFSKIFLTSIDFLSIFLSIGILMSGVYMFVFPKIPLFKRFTQLSFFIGTGIVYVIALIALLKTILYPLSFFISIIILVTSLYHYISYRYNKDYISYGTILLTTAIFYIKILPISESFFASIPFLFILPGVFILITFFLYRWRPLEVYILHYSAIIFSVLSSIYFFLFISSPSIFSLSVFFFLESFLLFWSYIRLKK